MNTSLLTMDKISKEQILTAVTAWYFDDLDFIEKINDITFHQKRKLQAIHGSKPNITPLFTNTPNNGRK